jgi:peptide/nickel transport system substrate-binding protein
MGSKEGYLMKNCISGCRDLKWLKKIIVSIFFIFISLPLICQGKEASNISKDDRLVVYMAGSILSLDPTNHRDRDTQMVLKNIFDSLTTRDKSLLVVPQLAESWQVIDQTTWEFKLRQNITFHNGDEFTARDVKFTLDRVIRENGIDGKTSPRKTLLGGIKEILITDRYTVRIITRHPWPILPLMLTLQEIVPSDYLQEVGSKNFENAPVGTGPFQFVEKIGEDQWVLKQFKNYYGGAPLNPPTQVAPLKHLIFKTVASQAKRIGMLKRGLADIITSVSPEALALFDMLPDINAVSQPATRSYFAELNCKKPPFNDVRTRLAVNYAMDMRRIVDMVLQSHGQILSTILLPQAFAYNDELQPYPYTPEKAKELLVQANFAKEYSIKIFCIKRYVKFASAISTFLSKAGIKSTITTGKKKDVREAMKNLKADILVTSWGNTTLDPVGILMPKWKSRGRGNFSHYSNDKVNKLLLAAENTLVSETRDTCYREVQAIVYKDVPMIFGYAAEEFYGVTTRVKNFHPDATGMLNLHDVYIEPRK